MPEVDTIQNGLMAIVVGMLVSPHCVAMCGPLSCALLTGGNSHAVSSDWSRTCYHLGRILSYMLIGALAGLLGLGLVSAFGLRPVQYFPWFLVGILLLFAFRLDRFLPATPWLRRLWQKLRPALQRIPQPLAGLGLGLATPALPCAPLYGVFWVALLSGSPLFGAEIALGFALGTIPLLWGSQGIFASLRRRFGPGIFLTVQRSAALLAALILVWRILATGDTPLSAEFCGLL